MSSPLVLQLLGSPQIHLDDSPISTDRRKAIALLAYLAVNDIGHPRHKYSRESLSTLLWPDYEQAKAFSNLRTTLWEVRQAIGDGWLKADRDSIQLNAEANIELDVARFRDLLSQSRQQSYPAERIKLLSEAVKLYRDHFLAGFNLKDAPNFNEWAFAESEELQRNFADALAVLSEDYCTVGRAEQAIPYARRLAGLDPLNDSAQRVLMEVYLQAGQRSAALKQYQGFEQTLRKELGVDPQPETHALYKQIQRGEIQPVQTVQRAVQDKPRHNLPLQLSSFIGREKELQEIGELVHNHRLVTLTGAGGIGKTRLSIQTASTLLKEFHRGTWLVELAPLSDPALVPQAIITALGLIEQAGCTPVTSLTDFLREKRALLVLDNCEHVVQSCAQLAETLLRACPDLHIITTSREALGIAGETLYLVPPLSTPDPLHTKLEELPGYEAVQLFVERAQATLPSFAMTPENASAIVLICDHLDGIPLALELAAARVRMFSVEEIASRLTDRLHLLTGGTRTALPRHQTLQALIDWSHDLLSEPERVLFRRLSIFAGGWTLEAAESIGSGEGIEAHETLDLLRQLLNKSLILVERRQGQATRYQMLETIRQYAREKLWIAGEGEPVRQRHLAYFVDLAEQAEPNLRAFDMVMWLDRLETELGNLRAALEWSLESDIQAELRLTSALLWFWHIRGHKNEGIDWLERGLSIEAMERGDQALTPDRATIRGKALNASGFLMSMFFEFAKAPVRLEESLALFRELGPRGKQGMAYALLRLGGIQDRGKRAKLIEESLALFREVGDTFGTAESLMLLAGNTQQEDYRQAQQLEEEQLALRREIGDRDGIATALANLGDLAFEQDDYHRAVSLYTESLSIFRELGNKWAVGLRLYIYGDYCLWQGDYERATQIYEEALALAQDVSDRHLIALNFYSVGVLAWFRGDYARASQMIMDGLGMFREVSDHWLIGNSLHALGDLSLAAGDHEKAVQWYQSELRFGREVSNEMIPILALGGLGKAAWIRGDYSTAAGKFEEALKMSREAGLKPAIFHILHGMGRVAQSRGNHAEARTYYQEALRIQGRRVGPTFNWAWLKSYVSTVAYPLEDFAVLAAAQNQMERAARLLGVLQPLYHLIQYRQSPVERSEHDQAVVAARAALGEETFAKVWAEGQAMTLEEAVAYALES
jgi:predicted ATPase/DNA-binding SARP family transcriptional activator